MATRLVLTEDYKAPKRALSASAKVALYFVEQGIESNPLNPPGFDLQRLPISELGDLVVTIVENGGLLVAFHVLTDGRASMDMVLDRRRGASWFSGQ